MTRVFINPSRPDKTGRFHPKKNFYSSAKEITIFPVKLKKKREIKNEKNEGDRKKETRTGTLAGGS
ncbi:MAG: hypothetical protein PHP98_11645, partial [Kiritimatiellae bacterium]|nr:hypothetical protein [Kiritimatiellia bacterium]